MAMEANNRQARAKVYTTLHHMAMRYFPRKCWEYTSWAYEIQSITIISIEDQAGNL